MGSTMTAPICKRPGCGKPAKVRGLCRTCYQMAYRLIRLGRATWAGLEDSGKVNKQNMGSLSRWFLKGTERP